MAKKTIKGYFFRPEKNGNDLKELASGREIIELLEHIALLPVLERSYIQDNSERSILLEGDHLSEMTQIPHFDGYRCGMFLHKRDVNLPWVGYTEEDTINLQPVDLGGGELMEVTYFIVHEHTGILLYLINRSVGSIKHLAYYLSNFLTRDGIAGYDMRIGNSLVDWLYLTPILNLNRLERVEQLLELKSISLRCVAKPEEWSEISKNSTLTLMSSFFSLTDYFEANSLHIELKTGRNDSLKRGAVKPLYTILQNLLSRNKRNKFIVRGKDQSLGYQEIDLISDQHLFTSKMTYEGRYLSSFDVFKEMKQNFDSRLNEMVGAPIDNV